MATVSRESIGALHDKITVKLTKEDYLPSFEKSLKQYAKQANVPGFRKGMVPAGMVRKMYGQSLFGDEVFRSAGKQLEDYLQQEKVAIFAQPMIMPGAEKINLDMNNPSEIDFSFEVGLKPEIDITPIKNKTTLSRYAVKVTDKMLDDEVERITRRFGKVESQEAVTGKDDIIYATYEQCNAEGEVAAESQKVEDTQVFETIPAKLQEQLKGKNAEATIVFRPMDIAEGEELTAFLKNPLKQDDTAAGQYYKLTITKVGLLIPRQLDTELYMQVFPNTDIADEAAFREMLGGELGKEFDRMTRERLQNEIYELLVHNTPIQLPVDFLKRWLKEGQEKQKSETEVEQEFPSFDHQLRWTLISDKLILENDIKVTHAEVLDDIKTRVLAYFGMQNGDEAPWLDGYMQKVVKDEKTMDETYRRMLYDRLFTFLEGQFTIEEKEVNEEAFFQLPDPHAAHHHHH